MFDRCQALPLSCQIRDQQRKGPESPRTDGPGQEPFLRRSERGVAQQDGRHPEEAEVVLTHALLDSTDHRCNPVRRVADHAVQGYSYFYRAAHQTFVADVDLMV